jgi:hypothetical protein
MQNDGRNGTMTNLIAVFFTNISRCKSRLMGSSEHVRDEKYSEIEENEGNKPREKRES